VDWCIAVVAVLRRGYVGSVGVKRVEGGRRKGDVKRMDGGMELAAS
jgi:hypothetical protein